MNTAIYLNGYNVHASSVQAKLAQYSQGKISSVKADSLGSIHTGDFLP